MHSNVAKIPYLQLSNEIKIKTIFFVINIQKLSNELIHSCFANIITFREFLIFFLWHVSNNLINW